MIRMLFLVSAACILSNCATSPSGDKLTEIDVDALPIHCYTEVPTGSHRAIRVCRSKAQIERERALGRALNTGTFGAAGPNPEKISVLRKQ